MNQAFDRYKQRWQQHHPADPQATPEEKRDAEEMKQQAEVYMGQAQRVDQPGQLPAPANEELSRVAKLAGVPVKEAWNANMGEIYEAANSMALAVYNLAILSNPAFRKREDSDGRLYATLQKFDPEDFEDTKELSQRDLADHGAKLTYNANNPRMFTLHVSKMEPYTFDVKEVVDTAVG
jgi:hypothetical protein